MMERFKNMDEKTKTIFTIAVSAVICVISLFLLRKLFSPSALLSGTVEYLDGKRKTVLELTAAATASSAAITMIPGDIGTPIASKLADISTYTLIVMCALFLEKYLVAITGHVAFGIIIPVTCLIFIGTSLLKCGKTIRAFAAKVTLFSLVLFITVPTSVCLSKLIENTYEDSITETIESAKDSAEEIQDHTASQSLWDKFISTIEGGVNALTDRFEGILNNFIEAIAILIVTACIIPVLVLIFMYWLIKMMFVGNEHTGPLLRLSGPSQNPLLSKS